MKTGQWIALAALGLGAGYLIFRPRSASAQTGTQSTQDGAEDPGVGAGSEETTEDEPLENDSALRDMVSRSGSRATLPSKGEYALREDRARPGKVSAPVERAGSAQTPRDQYGTLIVASEVPGWLYFSAAHPTGNEVDGGVECEEQISGNFQEKIMGKSNPGDFLLQVVSGDLKPLTVQKAFSILPGQTTYVRLQALSGVRTALSRAGVRVV